ncbi:MAG: response regulator [bacterium]|nr:response regulator [bacterium]
MKEKILIVDDDTITRKFVSFILRASGFEVTCACDGLEALEMLALGTVDLVVTDLNMPKMDGLELIRNIRDDHRYATLPVIMLTTEGDAEARQAAAAAGVSGYLVKPVSGEELAEKIRTCLSGAEIS